MTAIIYTYPPDYVMAAHVARAWSKLGVRPVLAIDQSDPRLAVEGVEIIRTTFDRQKNLNGREFILGHLGLMESLATGGYTIKCDSDTLPLSLDFLGDRTATGYGVNTGQLQGCCYALRVDEIPKLRADAEANLPRGKVRLMEDQMIGELIERNGVSGLRRQFQEWTGYVTHRPERDRAWCEQERVSLINFPLRKGIDRRGIVAAMKTFA
jgi:hypothetical protein